MPGADNQKRADLGLPTSTILQIQLDQSALNELHLHPRAYVKGTVIEDLPDISGTNKAKTPHQKIYRDVGVHLKGQYGTFQNADGKPSLTLNFDRFVKAQNFHGLDKFHLNNSVSDPTYSTEVLCRELFLAAGVPVGRASHARVDVNGRDLGLYVLVEGYNKRFLKQFFKDATGHLYDSEFSHDLSFPLKSSAASGPPDKSDLQRLVDAAEGVGDNSEIRNQKSEIGRQAGQIASLDPRLRKLQRVLDLDRFYSFLAMEILTCHFDGYARGINNYWLYHDPASEKFVFIPHGMDQMFYNPQSSLFPELKGIAAKALLETGEGRNLFRNRCAMLFTNLFPQLSNRVEQIRATIRPELARIGANAVAQHDKAVADLHRRISARAEYLTRHLFAPAPQLTPLAAGQQALVTNWLWSIEQGKATLTGVNASATVAPTSSPASSSGVPPHESQFEAGRRGPANSQPRTLALPSAPNTPDGGDGELLRIRLEPDDKAAVGTWEARVLLPPGVYQFAANVACDQKIFRGPNCPLSVKLWGAQAQQFESNRPDPQHVELLQTFAVTAAEPEEILIQCQAQSRDMNLQFDFTAPILTRIQ